MSALPLGSGLTLGEWAARDASLERGVRAWARGRAWLGAPRVYSDGVCEADVFVDSPDVLKQALAWRDEQERAGVRDLPTSGEITAAARAWPPLWVTGTAYASDVAKFGKAEGWEDISAEGVQLAKLAARADAVSALTGDAAKLKISAARRVHEFVESSDEVRAAFQSAIEAAAEVTLELAADQVCVAEARIRIPELVRALTEVHQQHYQGELFKTGDFRELALLAESNELRSRGLAPPPERYRIKPEFELIELDAPAWAKTTLSAAGRYQPQEGDDFPAAMIAELARWDAMDRLRRQVELLPIQRGITVERFLGYRTELKDDVVLFLSGARAVSRPQPRPDGGVEIRAELPLGRLWQILRRGANIVEVEPGTPASRPSVESSEVERAP
ncbi:MAG: hypothetical protein HZB38_09000 [Planctomycetes bacterium]|nr:hypothetical protein [Planctomycetota bacterium]